MADSFVASTVSKGQVFMFITSPFFSNIIVLSRAVCFSAVFLCVAEKYAENRPHF
jgi:hypothetical protein